MMWFFLVPVHIFPGSMGSFFMDIQGGGRPRVKFLSSILVMPPVKTP